MFAQYSFSRMLPAAALCLLLGLTACGGGGGGGSGGGGGGGGGPGGGTVTPPGGSSANGTDCTAQTSGDLDGCAYVFLDDVAGDFLTYTVKVTDISITRRDGTVAKIVPADTTVDFARYASLSEFLTLSAVPAGDYVSGTITLDFTGADIESQDSSGNAVKLQPVDASGKPLGAVTLTIVLDNAHPLGLFPGTPHVLGLDFDLNASNIVNSNQTVTVNPFILASADPATSNTEQLRGSLASADAGADSFTLALNPFQAGSGNYGDLVVYGTASTTYVVNQRVFTGSAGVSTLAAAGNNTAVLAQGSFDFGSHRFVATQVLAGSSVPRGAEDAVQGIVVARNGNTLSLLSSDLYHTSHVNFSDTATVLLDSSTIVCESANLALPKTIGDISVGQRLFAFGHFTNGTSTTLDASGGFVLLQFTDVDGPVLSLVDASTNSSVNLNVAAIGDRPIGMFNFTGTGSNPANFQVALPCSCLNTGVNVGDPVIVSGFAPTFSTTPPDFNAQALTDFDLADSIVSAVWNGGGTGSAFTRVDPNSGIVVNLSSSPAVHNLRQGAQVTDLGSLSSVPAVVSKVLGGYAILKNGNVQVYLTYSDFVTALQSDLSAGSKVTGFFAVGGYDGADALLNAAEVTVTLK